MQTKTFYHDGIWEAIISHPQYNLGWRELEALTRFLPVVAQQAQGIVNVLHLGVGNGREIPRFISHLNIGVYGVVDICASLLEKVVAQARVTHPAIQFSESCVDIEQKGAILKLRKQLVGPTLIVLIGNGVIFSNRGLDAELGRAMEVDDLFLVTAETPHGNMSASYTIDPVYRLLTQSGLDVNAGNTKTWYDDGDQCLKMSCQDQILLSSYKPTLGQLRQRLRAAGMVEVALREFQDIHMLGGLFRKS